MVSLKFYGRNDMYMVILKVCLEFMGEMGEMTCTCMSGGAVVWCESCVKTIIPHTNIIHDRFYKMDVD